MQRLPWNTCTTFAAIGSGAAYAILIPLFGLHWQLIPGGIAGLVAAYAVSTALGFWFIRIRIGRHPLLRVGAGIGAALLTLFSGVLALAVANFLVQTGIDLAHAPSGQPFWNAVTEFAPSNARDFVAGALLAGLLYGQVPAVALGIAYGWTLRPSDPPERMSAVSASASIVSAGAGGVIIALLFSGATTLLLVRENSLTQVPGGVPVLIGDCGISFAAGGSLAVCAGYTCEQGLCDLDTQIDALAIYVRGPENTGWEYNGGGVGSTMLPHVIRHDTEWVRPRSEDRLDESDPRRYVNYTLRFDGDRVLFRERSFEFSPGMLLVVRYANDWSYTVDVGDEALAETGVDVDQLRRDIDEIRARLTRN